MGNNNVFLIPANSKKSMLILSFFNQVDLIVFGTGIGLSFIFLMAIRTNSISTSLLILLPALIATFLVIPIPNQHYIRTFIGNIYTYFIKRRTYFWKGWSNGYVEEKGE